MAVRGHKYGQLSQLFGQLCFQSTALSSHCFFEVYLFPVLYWFQRNRGHSWQVVCRFCGVVDCPPSAVHLVQCAAIWLSPQWRSVGVDFDWGKEKNSINVTSCHLVAKNWAGISYKVFLWGRSSEGCNPRLTKVQRRPTCKKACM